MTGIRLRHLAVSGNSKRHLIRRIDFWSMMVVWLTAFWWWQVNADEYDATTAVCVTLKQCKVTSKPTSYILIMIRTGPYCSGDNPVSTSNLKRLGWVGDYGIAVVGMRLLSLKC